MRYVMETQRYLSAKIEIESAISKIRQMIMIK